MLYMAEAGLHSFDYDSGRWVNAELERTGLDEDAKHTVIVKLHPNEDVGQLLLQRCGMSSKWLTGNGARSLETHLHIGDDGRRDREIALRSGWEHQWPDQFQQP